MKLISFSVINFRSITKAYRLPISESTILIGKNNEGKSNILNAIAIAMSVIQRNSEQAINKRRSNRNIISTIRRRDRYSDQYNWQRDMPISLQNKRDSKSTFTLEFFLSEQEKEKINQLCRVKCTEKIAIEISIGINHEIVLTVKKNNNKKYKNGLSEKVSQKIADYLGDNIDFTYIPTIRTANESASVVEQMVEKELAVLESDPKYKFALDEIKKIQQPILENISQKITKPLQEFIPQVKNVQIEISQEARYSALRRSCKIIIDDGVPTSIEWKGDGIKSLAAISLLRGLKNQHGFSILALEEPESHLHPSAIHRLKEVIDELSKDHQVILTTHCSLFIDRVNISSNILISSNKATPAKSIKEIRELLGVRASDNLIHAKLVLVVEGKEDKIALQSLFSYHSSKLKTHLKNRTLVINALNGADNLSYKISTIANSLCLYHALMDNDDAGRKSTNKAENDGLLKINQYHLTTCNGMPNAEFEDCIDKKIYENIISQEFGINLNCKEFKNNCKWSDRVKNVFHSQGKPWSNQIESKVKYLVANEIKNNPENALNSHKKSSIDALIKSLEAKLN